MESATAEADILAFLVQNVTSQQDGTCQRSD